MKGLRRLRDRTSAAIGAMVAAVPAIERAYVRTGGWIAARSRLLGTVYWFSQDTLVQRLRQSGRRFRRTDVAGVRVFVDVTDQTGRLPYFYRQPHEPQLARAIVGCLSAGDVFLDVGANIGFFSVLAAKCVGATGAIAAFEPHPGARAILAQALAANGVAPIVDVVAAAVGGADGQARLFLTVDSILSTVDPSRAPLGDEYRFTESIDVPIVSLDQWVAKHPELRGRLRAVKIDVEGTEADVLRGFAETLAFAPPAYIFCETTPNGPADMFLRARGYHALPLDVREEGFGDYQYTRGAEGPR